MNYELPSSEREKTTNAFNVKLNYNPGSSDQISLRFSYQRPEIYVPGTFGELGGAGADFAGTGYQDTYSTALTWTRTLSQSLIMEWRAGYMKYHNEALSTGTGLDSSTEVGIPGANYDLFSSGISRISIGNGFTDPMVGFSNEPARGTAARRRFSVVGMLTKITGNHTVKVGTEVRHNEDFLLQIQDAGGVRGQFQFNGARTSIPTDGAATSGIANSFASFLLDAPSLVQRDIKALDRPGTKHWAVFAFVQDKWQVTPKLTVDLGLRWEYYTPLVGIEDQGGLSNYDPSNNTVEVAGYGSIPQNIGVESTWTNFAPRLGASYRFDEKTVLRAGFGTTIIPFPDNRYAYNFPVKQTEQFNAPNGFAPAGSMAAGFGAPTFFPIPSSGVVDASIPQLRNAQLFYVPSDLKEAKLHSWNVAFQRQLPWNLVGEVAYVGNVGKGIVGHGLQHQRGHGPRRRQRGAAALRPALRPHGERAVVVRRRHELPLAAGQARPALQERLPRHDVVHPEPRGELRRRGRHRDSGRRRAELRAGRLRPHARVRVGLHLGPAVLQGGQRRPALDPRRLAVQRHLHRVLRDPDQLHGVRGHARRPGQHPVPERQRRARGLRRHRPGAEVLRHGGLLGAGAEHLGRP